MVKFQNPSLFMKGTCNFILADSKTGDVKYQDSKFSTNNITTSATLDPIRGGLGDPVATIIASDSSVEVKASSVAFNLFAKAAQVGASVSFNAVGPTCDVITASGSTISVDVTKGTPVAQYGYSKIFGYVTTVNATNLVAAAGTAYEINPTTGAVVGFTATNGTQYKVWYFINKASAQVAPLSAMFNPGVYHATAQIAVYSNQADTASGDQSMRVGWFYYVIPYLKLKAVANVVGDQTTPDTTDLSGTALSYDAAVESAECTDCDMAHLAYYIYVPDDGTETISGLAVVGGLISLPKSSTKQIPVKYVMQDNTLVQPNYTDLKYTLSTAPSGTAVSAAGVITAGATAGDCEVTIEYPKTGTVLHKTVANVSVT